MMSPLQLKLARTALDLTIRDLAQLADVAPSTITRFESGNGGTQRRTLEHLQATLENQGVVFFEADASGGPGVRLKT
jgi:transcriptional regulator with XRE-family HTH domain